MSLALAHDALSHWGLSNCAIDLVAKRENIVYRIYEPSTSNTYALRLHRPGLRSEIELRSESQWLQALSTSGLDIASPIVTNKGAWGVQMDDHWIDLQTWLQGETIDQHAMPQHYRALGVAMAQLHSVSDGWSLPAGFDRPTWDGIGLVGDNPVWGPFWENPELNADQRSILLNFRAAASSVLHEQREALDFGLIHADLVSENVLVDNHRLHLIDFDDSGFGYRMFDIATTILRLQRQPEQEDLVDALLEGYVAKRSIDLSTLDLFLALRACTYIGWIVPRRDETGSAERCARFISNGVHYAERWLVYFE